VGDVTSDRLASGETPMHIRARDEAVREFMESRRAEEYVRWLLWRMPQSGLDALLLSGIHELEAQLGEPTTRERAAMKLRLISEEDQRRRTSQERPTRRPARVDAR
jgi:hypothetical protein